VLIVYLWVFRVGYLHYLVGSARWIGSSRTTRASSRYGNVAQSIWEIKESGIAGFFTVLILESGWRWLRFSQSLYGIWSRGCCWPCEGNEPRGIDKANLLIAAGSTWQSSDGWLLKTKRGVQQQLHIPPKVMCCCCLPVCERDRMMLEV
jgi:hypothetical protein